MGDKGKYTRNCMSTDHTDTMIMLPSKAVKGHVGTMRPLSATLEKKDI